MKNILLPEPGTYIIIIRIDNVRNLEVGRIGNHYIKKGYYFYVGSAFGPGGIRARISRHLKKDKTRRWHIDYLRDAGSISGTLIYYGAMKKECIWASNLALSRIISMPIKKFGSSDCACESHLFYSNRKITGKMLKSILKETGDIHVFKE